MVSVSLSLWVCLLCWLCLFPVLIVGATPPSCQWKDPISNSLFDFAPLSIRANSKYKGKHDFGGWWSQTCTTDKCINNTDAAKLYEYTFNICATTLQIPLPEKCAVTADVSAYQYNLTGNICYAIGNLNQQSEELLVPGKPSQGYKLRYGGGETCQSVNTSRTLTVHVRCSANLPANPQLDYSNINKLSVSQFKSNSYSAVVSVGDDPQKFDADPKIATGDVYENSTCDYHVNLDTVFGCPTSCLSSDNLACSDHGICAEDTDANNNIIARCFCDVGYGGDKCQSTVDTSSSSSRSPNTVLSVFVLILLFAALGLGYALYRKIRGFHGDYDHQYGQLDDGGKQGRGMNVNA